MPTSMPSPKAFSGLSRTVIAYSKAFADIVAAAKAGAPDDEAWTAIESLVDTAAFRRLGVFLGPRAEILDWPTYRSYVSNYAAGSDWDGTLRHITESGNRVILELEERGTRGGVTDVSNTVTTYDFTDAGKLRYLEVYVMPLEAR